MGFGGLAASSQLLRLFSRFLRGPLHQQLKPTLAHYLFTQPLTRAFDFVAVQFYLNEQYNIKR